MSDFQPEGQVNRQQVRKVGEVDGRADGLSSDVKATEATGEGTSMRIKFAQIFVDDQDRAVEFYTGKLGFQVKTDAAYGPGARWLTVVSPEDPDGPELLLGLPDEAASAFHRHVYENGRPAISLTTTDLDGEYTRLKDAGVNFTMPPTQMPYGGTDAVFDDTCGNYINLHQD